MLGAVLTPVKNNTMTAGLMALCGIGLVLVSGCPHDLTRLGRPEAGSPDGSGDSAGPDADQGLVADGPARDLGAVDGPLTDQPHLEAGGDLPGPAPDVSSGDLAPGSCGDNKRQGAEQCDGADLASKTCATLSFGGGTLKCGPKCNFDTAGCHLVLDPSGQHIAGATTHLVSPGVAAGSGAFLVAWQARSSSKGNSYTTHAARTTTGGAVLDKGGIKLDSTATTRGRPGVSHDGTNVLVLWASVVGKSQDIIGLRVSNAGVKLSAAPVKIALTPTAVWEPQVAYDGANYLAAWGYDGSYANKAWDIEGAQVSSAGIPLGTKDTVLSNYPGNQQLPAVACGKGTCLVVWQDTRSGGSTIFGTRVLNGVAQDLLGFQVALSGTKQLSPSVAWAGGVFLVVWEHQPSASAASDIRATRVNGAGYVLNPAGITVCAAAASQQRPRVAALGNGFQVVWQDRRAGRDDIYGARVNSAGGLLSGAAGFGVASYNYNKRYPDLACTADTCQVVWQELRGALYSIRGGRLK